MELIFVFLISSFWVFIPYVCLIDSCGCWHDGMNTWRSWWCQVHLISKAQSVNDQSSLSIMTLLFASFWYSQFRCNDLWHTRFSNEVCLVGSSKRTWRIVVFTVKLIEDEYTTEEYNVSAEEGENLLSAMTNHDIAIHCIFRCFLDNQRSVEVTAYVEHVF